MLTMNIEHETLNTVHCFIQLTPPPHLRVDLPSFTTSEVTSSLSSSSPASFLLLTLGISNDYFPLFDQLDGSNFSFSLSSNITLQTTDK